MQCVRQARSLPVAPVSLHAVSWDHQHRKNNVANTWRDSARAWLSAIRSCVETDQALSVNISVKQHKTRRTVDAARDGVLFIDETYALTQSGSGMDFGTEAISTLVKLMEDNREKLVVIAAGYSQEIVNFRINTGFRSR